MHATDTHLADAVESLRSGATDPGSYLDRCRDRLDRLDGDIAAFLPEPGRWERIDARLEELGDDAGNRPPLYGVPVGVKDIFHVDGVPTRAGSDVPAEALDGPESTTWRRLADAGAVFLGKTVTTEFARRETGPTRNPHDRSRTPGGSSSGSAAAVAAGLCPLAIGSQTGGSVIRPAAFCGVVGFKPSYGRIPTDGVVPVSETLDHVGTFTQDVAGAALAGSALCDDWEPVPAPTSKPVLGVPDEAYLDRAEAAARDRFERLVDRLSAAGFEVRRTDALADVDRVEAQHSQLMNAEMAMAHREAGWYPEYADGYRPRTREYVEEGGEATVADLAAARTFRREHARRLAETRRDRGVDCWVAPAAPGPAPEGLDYTGDAIMNLPWTAAGVPAVTLPVETTDSGLPLGLQCVGAYGADEDLLGWAELLASELGLLTDP
jgi:Asp-tRNA(Asn)/Glu-tRNA(Gln) amidotransferase A subunit family amidase